MDNYTLSNSIESLPNIKLSATTKNLFISLREKSKLSQYDLQSVSNAICDDVKVARVTIVYGGVQSNVQVNGKLKRKTLGTYNTGSTNIRIYEYTAVRKQPVSSKTNLDTLLHELMHHFDCRVLRLQESIHSAGFYKRIGNLKTELLK